MARSASALGLLVTAVTGIAVARAGTTHGFAQLSGTSLAVAGIVAISGLGFALLACRFSRQFVTQLEIWPRSNLAVVRTAGCCREQIRLLGWNEFRTGNLSPQASRHDALLRVHTRSGQRLAFDQDHGVAPHGWVALHRFLEKCSVPELGHDEVTVIDLPAVRQRA